MILVSCPFATGPSLAYTWYPGSCVPICPPFFFWLTSGQQIVQVAQNVFVKWMWKNPARLMAFLAQCLMVAVPQQGGWLAFKMAEFSGLFSLLLFSLQHCCAGGIELGVCVGVRMFQTPTLSHLLTCSYCALTVAFRISYLSLHHSCTFYFLPSKFRGKDLTTNVPSLLLPPS